MTDTIGSDAKQRTLGAVLALPRTDPRRLRPHGSIVLGFPHSEASRSVVRKWLGHDHIPQRFAPEVNPCDGDAPVDHLLPWRRPSTSRRPVSKIRSGAFRVMK